MAYGILNDEHLIAIGDAIRTKNNTTNTYKASEMAAAITNLPGEETLDQVLEGTIIGDYYNDRITTLNSSAFANSKLTSIDLPNVTSVSSSALSNMRELTSINLSNATSIGSYAFSFSGNSNNSPDITLPKLTYVSNYTFQYCGFASITLPKVTEVGDYAFYHSAVTKLDFTNLKEIGNYAFNNCTNLTTLILRHNYLYFNTSQLNDSYSFINTPIANGKGYIYVPQSMLQAYQTGVYWDQYASQFRAIEDYPDICG